MDVNKDIKLDMPEVIIKDNMTEQTKIIDISLVASACRPQWWGKFMQSLEGTKCSYEVIFVGPVPPYIKEGNNPHLKWVHSYACPALCYEIGFRLARGKLVGYTADDAIYEEGALDKVWEKIGYKQILAMTLYEDYGGGFQDNTAGQKLGTWPFAPLMAPFGFINRQWLKKLGGYDRNFTHGQAENDLVMRALEDKGIVKVLSPRAAVWVDHQKCHNGLIGSDFSKEGFKIGRAYLERCWVWCGMIQYKRRLPFEPFTIEEAGKWQP